MAATMTALEAKTRFGALLERVAGGEEIVVTRYDKPVARIIPADKRSLRDVRAAVAGLRDLRRSIAAQGRSGSKLSDAQIKSLIDEGRS